MSFSKMDNNIPDWFVIFENDSGILRRLLRDVNYRAGKAFLQQFKKRLLKRGEDEGVRGCDNTCIIIWPWNI